jgi:hypothetical protein
VIARFQPVEKFIMQVADPTPIYTTVNLLPAPSLLWQTQANRPPYGLVRFRNTTSGFEATAVPDSTGAFRFHEPPPAPGSRYAYRVSWFDGEAERDTGDFVIDAAPHPQDIGFAFGPVSIRGRDVVVRFGASDDSARMLSRQMLQRRFPPGDWQDVWDILFPVDTIYVEPSVSPRSLVEFRAGWGDPVARTWSAPVQVQMNPEPVFRSVAWTQGVVDIRYTIEPGYPFAGSIYRAGPLEPGFVLVGPAVAAADGSIHVQDATVPRDIVPVQYEYHLEWNVGGVVVGDEAHPVMLPAVARVAILDLTNPARDAISFSVEVRDAGPCRAEVYDVNGRRIWQETFGGPGTHPVTLRGPAGLYFVRIVRGKMTESKRVVLIQ